MTTLERAFEMMSESILIQIKDKADRKRIAEELREYFLKKAEKEGGHAIE